MKCLTGIRIDFEPFIFQDSKSEKEGKKEVNGVEEEEEEEEDDEEDNSSDPDIEEEIQASAQQDGPG